MAIKFLLKQDIQETTIKKSYESFKLTNTEVMDFIETINGYYLDECLEKGVDEDDILVYNPNEDSEDLRYKSIVKLCRWWFLEEVLFSYTTSEDSAKWIKYKEAVKRRKELMGKLSYNRIIGEKPAEIKTEGGYMTMEKELGEY